MLFTSILFSALAVATGASAGKTRNAARQAAIASDEIKILFQAVNGGSTQFTLNEANLPETLNGPASGGLFNAVSFESGADVDPALRCRIFDSAAAGIEDVILVNRGTNKLKNSFSKGLPWIFDAVPIDAVQCEVVENVFFASPE